ncbi:hypothetical protein FX984_06374 [Pseudomonas marginalis]|nr:hypothetical protein FX984_06374 [Pseudomonas marginalis]
MLSHHGGFAHIGLLTQARLNLSQFDTEPTHLDLMVDAADVLDHAIRAIARQVACAIKPLAVARKRVGHKTFGGQRSPAVIPPGQADTADQQLACNAYRARHEIGIKNEQ